MWGEKNKTDVFKSDRIEISASVKHISLTSWGKTSLLVSLYMHVFVTVCVCCSCAARVPQGLSFPSEQKQKTHLTNRCHHLIHLEIACFAVSLKERCLWQKRLREKLPCQTKVSALKSCKNTAVFSALRTVLDVTLLINELHFLSTLVPHQLLGLFKDI